MKKNINIKAAMQALREAETAYSEVKYAGHYSGKDRLEKAKANYESKQAIFKELAEAALGDAIREAEGRATARTLTAATIVEALAIVEDKLNITKKAMEGIVVTADWNAQSFPRAYKYTPESTHFSAVYKAGSWRVTNIWRDRCTSGERFTVTHTDVSRAALIERFTRFSTKY